MKHILLILAVVVCVAVAGTALAVAYYNASNVSGTITTDSYMVLSFDGSSTANALTLDAATPNYYTIVCKIDKSASATGTGTLTLALNPDTTNSKTLANVSVALFTDSACTTPLQVNAENVVLSGAAASASVSVANIPSTTTYYAKITLASGLSQEQLAAIGGELQLDFVRVNA